MMVRRQRKGKEPERKVPGGDMASGTMLIVSLIGLSRVGEQESTLPGVFVGPFQETFGV